MRRTLKGGLVDEEGNQLELVLPQVINTDCYNDQPQSSHRRTSESTPKSSYSGADKASRSQASSEIQPTHYRYRGNEQERITPSRGYNKDDVDADRSSRRSVKSATPPAKYLSTDNSLQEKYQSSRRKYLAATASHT